MSEEANIETSHVQEFIPPPTMPDVEQIRSDAMGQRQTPDAAVASLEAEIRNSVQQVEELARIIDDPIGPSQPPPAVTPEVKWKRNFNMELVLNSTLFRIIKEHHQSEVARALILKTFGKSPPKELDTFDKVREWIETTFPGLPSAIKSSTTNPQIPTSPVTIVMDCWKKEVGNCRYTIEKKRVVEVSYGLDDMIEIIEGADSEDSAVESIIERVERQIGDGDLLDNEDWEVTNEDHYSHEYSEIEDSNTSLRDSTNLRLWLRANLPQDIREELGML